MSDLNINEFGACSCPIRTTPKGPIVPHWRSLIESKYLSHFELNGRDVSVTIKSVVLADVVGTGGKKSKKALMMFEGKTKGMVAGATVLKTIARIHGDDYATWPGKRITIYPTTTEASGETVGTIRVRPTAPAAPGRQAAPAAPQQREPSDDGEDEDDRNRRLAAPAEGEMP